MAIVVESVTTTGETNGSTISLSKPASTAQYDLLVIHIMARGDGSGIGGNSVNSVPSGWTLGVFQAGTGGNVYQSGQYYWKVAGSSEPSTYDFGLESSMYYNAGIYRISGAAQSSPIYASNSSFLNNTQNPNIAAGITANRANSLIIQLYSGIDGASSLSDYAIVTDNITWTEAYDLGMVIGGAGTGRFGSAYGLRTAITATGNMSATAGGSGGNDWAGIMIAIAPLILINISDTATVTDSASLLKTTIITTSDTATITDSYSEIKSKEWHNTTKNNSTWTNQSKS